LFHVEQLRACHEKNGGGTSPGCSRILVKSTDRFANRGGVPVFNRNIGIPNLANSLASASDAARPSPPPGHDSIPT